jgi:hypothetical protein
MNQIENPVHLRELILTWQDPQARRRKVIGRAQRRDGGVVAFRYVNERDELVSARAAGFGGYPAFPDVANTEKEYTAGVLESFASRLPKKDRGDYGKYLQYWFVSPETDLNEFDLLGYTGAVIARDGFRFLPVFPESGTFDFVTEVAGARYQDRVPVAVGDGVMFRPEPNNEHDPDAVEVICPNYDNRRLGYVMRAVNAQFLTWLAAGSVVGQVARINGTSERPVVLLHVWVNVP